MATKYLYKYVTKGPDRAMATTTVDGVRDEISEYEDMRSVGSGEAARKIFAFPIAENKPAVQKLRLHLEDEQHINFVAGDEDVAVERGQETELIAFFKFNAEEKERLGTDFKPKNMPTYLDMPLTYTYEKANKK